MISDSYKIAISKLNNFSKMNEEVGEGGCKCEPSIRMLSEKENLIRMLSACYQIALNKMTIVRSRNH